MLAANHPLRGASWRWPEWMMDLHNHFALFRRDFTLPRPPRRCPFFITADKAYKLFVNGVFVCRGPARGYQDHWPFDEVDLAPYLARGENFLCVQAYNPGVGTFQYLHRSCAGMLCAMGPKSVAQAFEASPWAMRRSVAHRRDTARYSMQLDFQEHADLNRDDFGWLTTATPPGPWEPRHNVPAAQHMLGMPFGRAPYDNVEPRGIPLLRERVEPLRRATAQATGSCDPRFRAWDNVSWGWMSELQHVSQWEPETSVATQIVGDALEVRIDPPGPGRFRAVTFDAGQIVVGNLIVEASGARGGEVLDFHHDQHLPEGRPVVMTPGTGCSVAMGNRLTLAAGANRFEFFHLLGFRHVTLIARELTQPVTIRLSLRTAGYAFEMRGRFECGEPTLNAIHAISRRTQQLCALDAYVDTPWREQAQWWGDARVQGRNTFYLDGDDRLLARGIRSLAGQSTLNGLTYGHAPTIAYGCILPDFSLTWILTLFDHYWQTGSPSLFRELWPRARRVLRYFDSKEARHPSGLLRYDQRYWLFEDWSTLCKDAVPTFLNLWYLYTLRHLVVLLQAAGKSSAAANWSARAQEHQALASQHLFDAGTGRWHGGLDAALRPVGPQSVHDATLAMLMDLQPQSHEALLRSLLLPWVLEDRVPEVAAPSAFWATYVFELLAARGHREEVIACIRRRWSPMLATGTTWEDWNFEPTNGISCCHAWAAHPSYHLVHCVVGLTQTAAGWREVRFEPRPVADLPHAQAVIPSPLGLIEAAWRSSPTTGIEAHLDLPPGVTATVKMPNGSTQQVAAGRHEFR